MNFLKAAFQRKRAGAMVFGVVVKVLATLGLDPALADAISEVVVQLVGIYILGQSASDLGLALKGAKKE